MKLFETTARIQNDYGHNIVGTQMYIVLMQNMILNNNKKERSTFAATIFFFIVFLLGMHLNQRLMVLLY